MSKYTNYKLSKQSKKVRIRKIAQTFIVYKTIKQKLNF